MPRGVLDLEGEIELAGAQGKKDWEAVLFVEHFLETVLGRLEFEPPEPEADPSNPEGPG